MIEFTCPRCKEPLVDVTPNYFLHKKWYNCKNKAKYSYDPNKPKYFKASYSYDPNTPEYFIVVVDDEIVYEYFYCEKFVVINNFQSSVAELIFYDQSVIKIKSIIKYSENFEQKIKGLLVFY